MTNKNTLEFEQLLRRRLGEFADQAPTTVRQIDDLTVSVDQSNRAERFGSATRRKVAGIGAAVIALGGGVALTTVAATGGEDGGANTPEEAVLEFIDALEQRDVIGAIDVLDPAESQVMVDVVRDVAGEAKRVGLLSGDANLQDVSGTSVGVNELVLTSESIGTSLALVHLDGGQADIQFDFAGLPFGLALNEAITRVDNSPTIEGTSLDLAQSDLSIATVERGGQWYVSVGFTLAETVRDAARWPSPLGVGVESEGFESPEAAATALWTRLAGFDLDGAIATAAPGEGDALARYASLWVPDAERVIGNQAADGFTLAIDGLTFDVSGDGDHRTAEPIAYRVTGTLPPLDMGQGPPTFDPSRPTRVFEADGSGIYVIPAGEPIPDSFDGLEPVADFDEATLDIDGWNEASILPDRTLQTFWSDIVEPVATDQPRPFTLEHVDGCTTVGGMSNDSSFYGRFGSQAVEELPNGDLRACGPTDALTTLGSIAFFFGAGAPPALPSIDVVEVNGQWYVSPIGSIGAMVLEVMAGMDDDRALAFDGPLGMFTYGFSSDTVEPMVMGRNADELTDLCRTALVIDVNDIVTDFVDAPTVEAVQDCMFGGSFDGEFTVEEGTSIEPPMPIDAPTSTIVLGGE